MSALDLLGLAAVKPVEELRATRRKSSRCWASISSTPTDSADVHASGIHVPPRRPRAVPDEPNNDTRRGRRFPSARVQMMRERLVHPAMCVRSQPPIQVFVFTATPCVAPFSSNSAWSSWYSRTNRACAAACTFAPGYGGRRHHPLLGGEVLHDVVAEEVEQELRSPRARPPPSPRRARRSGGTAPRAARQSPRGRATSAGSHSDGHSRRRAFLPRVEDARAALRRTSPPNERRRRSHPRGRICYGCRPSPPA